MLRNQQPVSVYDLFFAHSFPLSSFHSFFPTLIFLFSFPVVCFRLSCLFIFSPDTVKRLRHRRKKMNLFTTGTSLHVMKKCGELMIAPCILNPSTKWMWMIGFTSRPHYPEEKASDTYWRGRLSLRAGLYAVEKSKISCHVENQAHIPW